MGGGGVHALHALRRHDAKVDRDHRGELDLEANGAAVDLTADEEGLVALALDRARERGLRPAEVLRELLGNLARVAVDRLLSAEDEVGFLFFDEGFQRARDDVAVDLLVARVDADGAVGARSEHRAEGGVALFRPERDHDHLAHAGFGVRAVLRQAKGGLHGVLVERVRLPLETRRHELARVDLHFVRVVGVGDALQRNENLQGRLLFVARGRGPLAFRGVRTGRGSRE